ncbi:hypothetical protein H4R33_000295 [Dimargaris cristalligena]|uniref:F-box domain-containing protein n=1 Tax=Dimargaris cristalligena TaxID=215637 RepID=A0A4Q0A3H4_9FUNG|nr:hypothetical protein H4R33_000295 [Dimargaris cristalligena]RKP40141.1 hypothetical protein BJ085DRAFT_33853 [Dimargaris cristalligena]|eukprot:RKP40141.1 hypothetical protein BJ085DRAFT_33853 [Dimargaris cristalligena]
MRLSLYSVSALGLMLAHQFVLAAPQPTSTSTTTSTDIASPTTTLVPSDCLIKKLPVEILLELLQNLSAPDSFQYGMTHRHAWSCVQNQPELKPLFACHTNLANMEQNIHQPLLPDQRPRAIRTALLHEYNSGLLFEAYQQLEYLGIDWQGNRLVGDPADIDPADFQLGTTLLEAQSGGLREALSELRHDWAYLRYDQLPAYQQYQAFPLVFLALRGRVVVVARILHQYLLGLGEVGPGVEVVVVATNGDVMSPSLPPTALFRYMDNATIDQHNVAYYSVGVQAAMEIVVALADAGHMENLRLFRDTLLQGGGPAGYEWSNYIENYFYMVILEFFPMSSSSSASSSPLLDEALAHFQSQNYNGLPVLCAQEHLRFPNAYARLQSVLEDPVEMVVGQCQQTYDAYRTVYVDRSQPGGVSAQLAFRVRRSVVDAQIQVNDDVFLPNELTQTLLAKSFISR